MAAPLSSVIFNAFEQLLSGDVNRVQKLSSRELQNLLMRAQTNFLGDILNGWFLAPFLTSAAGFTMDVSAADGFMFSSAGVTADDSGYQALRWDAQNLAFAAPDPINPRIDLVVVEPQLETVDLLVRNILTNPTLRTVAATPVFKTQNPNSTLSVVTGTPAASPSAPAVPVGKAAVFEVRIPAAAPSSATFRPVPRTFPNQITTLAKQHAVVNGCEVAWPYSGGNAVPFIVSGAAADAPNLAIIDGEPIFFSSHTTQPAVFGDGNAGNDPFTVPNAGTASRPYYLYLVGGRNSPQSTATGTGDRVPVAVVASLVPPTIDGHPSAAITPPAGGALSGPFFQGALYIGLGFTLPGGTNSQACCRVGDMVYGTFTSIEQQIVSGAAFPRDVNLDSIPDIGQSAGQFTRAKIRLGVKTTTGGASMALREFRAATAGARVLRFDAFATTSPFNVSTEDHVPVPLTGIPQFQIEGVGAVAADETELTVNGWQDHVPRIGGV
jgi:hypothetical protein